MKRILLMGAVLTAMLMLPAMASATHFNSLTGVADCEGFMASADIHWRSTVDTADLIYDVVVLDGDNNEVTSVSGTITITKTMIDEVYEISAMFPVPLDGNFTVVGTFSIYGPWAGGVDEDEATFENTVECGSVANEEVSFEAVKALYR